MNTTPTSPSHPKATTGFREPRSADVRFRVHATEQELPARERAVVLGGAGAAGNAWEIGVVAGLFEAGLDLTEADLFIGTSAGSTAAAQITSGTSPTELLANVLGTGTGRVGPGRGRAPIGPAPDTMARTSAVIADSANAADMRRRMGAAALAADHSSDTSIQSQWRAVAAARLLRPDWPQQLLLITAVDANTGEPMVFDRNSGVNLVDAVAASTSIGFGIPPYRIGASRYINGGYRRNENADLAVGYARVLVLSPFAGRSRYPQTWGMDLSTQVDELRACGGSVETIFPEHEAAHIFGENAMDPSLRPSAAQAGYEQGRRLVEQLMGFWR